MRQRLSLVVSRSVAVGHEAQGQRDRHRTINNNSTARGFEPLRAEPNGFRVHHLSHSVTLSCSLHACTTWPVCYSSESCESCRTSVHEVMLNTPCALVVSSLAWSNCNPQGVWLSANAEWASLGRTLLKHTAGGHGHTIWASLLSLVGRAPAQ